MNSRLWDSACCSYLGRSAFTACSYPCGNSLSRSGYACRRLASYTNTTAVPAIFQGVQFNFLGLFFVGIALLTYFNNWQEVFHQMVRRPGLPLVVLGGLALLQAMIMFWGRGGTGEQSRGITVFVLLLGRLFPGFIWLVLGVGLMMLGLFDALAPARFDELVGTFLEELYELR